MEKIREYFFLNREKLIMLLKNKKQLHIYNLYLEDMLYDIFLKILDDKDEDKYMEMINKVQYSGCTHFDMYMTKLVYNNFVVYVDNNKLREKYIINIKSSKSYHEYYNVVHDDYDYDRIYKILDKQTNYKFLIFKEFINGMNRVKLSDKYKISYYSINKIIDYCVDYLKKQLEENE
jgi:hypothetical protein